jgi:hypothetical protein
MLGIARPSILIFIIREMKIEKQLISEVIFIQAVENLWSYNVIKINSDS